MNHPKQRSRGRGNNNGGKSNKPFNRNQVLDSNGPEGRIRGNAHQVMEKYLAMARDASSQGDRVAAENYYQHAEHYFRVINAHGQGQKRPPQPSTPAEDQAEVTDGEEDEAEQAEGAVAADGTSEPVSA